MIFYRNFHRKLQNKQEEIEAIRQCNGKPDSEAGEFELIELVLKKVCISPEKRHGFQDTDITHEQDGSVVIAHRTAGSGMLRFEPNNYGNPMGFLAKTKHNMETLIRCYHNKEWTYMNKSIEDEVKKGHEKYWKSLPEKDRKMADLMIEQARQDRFSIASDPTPLQPIKAESTNRVLSEMAELRAENERLKAALNPPAKEPATGVTPPEAVKPPEAPPIPMSAEDEFTNVDSYVVTAKDGTIYDFNKIPNFEVRRIAKKYGIEYSKDVKKDQLIGLVLDAIEKENDTVSEPATVEAQT